MPTYNGERYLPAALESIRIQGDSGIEVIAVDDGSTDGTLQILRQSSQSLPLVLIERGRIGNWVANTNHAFSVARGEYLSMLHQDDCWLPERLAVLRGLLADRSPPLWLCHASWFIDANGKRLGKWHCPLPSRPEPLPGDLLRQRLLVQNFLFIGAVIFRRDAALAVGGMDERLSYAADWDFWLKLAVAGDAIYRPEPLSCFRIHDASQTVAISRDSREFERQLDAVLDRHLEPWLTQHPNDRGVARAARFSVKMNSALAGLSQGIRPDFLALARQGLALGPCGWHRYLRDSRIIERTLSRLRAMRRRRANRET